MGGIFQAGTQVYPKHLGEDYLRQLFKMFNISCLPHSLGGINLNAWELIMGKVVGLVV